MTQPELSDAELAEWLAINVMKWRREDYHWFDRLGNVAGLVRGAYGDTLQDWNPAQNISQAFMVQDKLRELCSGEAMKVVDGNAVLTSWGLYGDILWNQATNSRQIANDLLSADARTRCRAIYHAMKSTQPATGEGE